MLWDAAFIHEVTINGATVENLREKKKTRRVVVKLVKRFCVSKITESNEKAVQSRGAYSRNRQ